ncbi:hypothetical protein CY35_02G074600 [Sphagnum magellanicum]|nr:hypothetical protein CY35_02G074600 [Sphagnum magellanicum]
MNGAYLPPVYVPDLHSDEKDDDLPPLSPSQTQHLLDHGGSMSSAAAVQQHPPQQQQQQQQAAFHWTSGICACFDNMPVCCLGCWCPCVLFGRNVEMLEGRPWLRPSMEHVLLWGIPFAVCCALSNTAIGLLVACVPCYACRFRRALRSKYNLEDAPCGDLITHLCCHMCANCQEHREMCERTTMAIDLSLVRPPPTQRMGAEYQP